MLSKVLFCSVVAFRIFAQAGATEIAWSTVTTTGTVPSARDLMAFAYDGTNNRLVMFGGADVDGTRLSDTWVFDIGTSTWTEITSTAGTAPAARRDMVADEDRINQRMVMCCGQAEDGSNFNDLWALSYSATITSMAWTQLSPTGDIPEVRYGQGGGIYPNAYYMYVTHGFDADRYSNTYRLDLSSLVWQRRRDTTHEMDPWAPHSRCLVGSVMVGADELVMYGGCASAGGTAGPCPAQDGWVYSDRTATWKQMDICPTPRRWPAMARLPGDTDKVILHGGAEKTGGLVSALGYQARQVDVLNTRTGQWEARKATDNSAVPARRSGHKMVTTSSVIYMFGGLLESGSKDSTLYILQGSVDEADEIYGCPGYLSYTIIHAIFMFLAWGFFLQIGSLMARYFKHRDPYWFKMHRRFQITGLVMSFFGLIFGFISVASAANKLHFFFTHGAIGLIVVVLGFQQPLNAFIRPHKGKSWRPLWEFIHKGSGRLALLLGLVNITLGLFVIVAPIRIWVLWCVLLGMYCIMHIVLTQQKYNLLNHVTVENERNKMVADLSTMTQQLDATSEELQALRHAQQRDEEAAAGEAAQVLETNGKSKSDGFMGFFKRDKKKA